MITIIVITLFLYFVTGVAFSYADAKATAVKFTRGRVIAGLALGPLMGVILLSSYLNYDTQKKTNNFNK